MQVICWDHGFSSIFPGYKVLTAAWKVIALSDVILVGFSRLLVNRLIASKHESVVRSPTTSKCTTAVLKQMKIVASRRIGWCVQSLI